VNQVRFLALYYIIYIYGRNENILKYHRNKKYVIVPLLHNENELF